VAVESEVERLLIPHPRQNCRSVSPGVGGVRHSWAMVSQPVRYRMPPAARAFFWVWIGGLTCVTAASGVLFGAWTAGGHGPPVLFTILWLGVLASVWYYGLVVMCIETHLWPEDGRLQFRSLLRKRETNISEVVDVDFALHGLNQRLVTIRYRRGYRRRVARLPNLESTWDLVHRIQESNPTVEVKRRAVDPWRTTP